MPEEVVTDTVTATDDVVEPLEATTPEPEPVPDVEPSWLDDPEPVPQAPTQTVGPQPPPVQQPYYQPPQPQYPQQPSYQPDQAQLEQLVQNPGQFVAQNAQAVAQQAVAPMAYQMQQMEQATRQFIEARTSEAIAESSEAIGKNYKEVLNQDEAFKNDRAVREQTENALKSMYRDARREAAQGRFGKLNAFKDPMLFQMTVQAAKMRSGYKPSAAEMARVGKQMVAAAAPRASKDDRTFTPDQEAAFKRLGDGFRERFIEAEKKYGDRIEW